MDESNWATELQLKSVALLGEGWDSEVFEVNSDWLVRFPKRAAVQRRLAIERAVLPHIAARLDIEVPNFELVGRAGRHFPYAFCGYRKLPGTPLQECLDQEFSPAGLQRMARQLGAALTGLHSVDHGACGVELGRPELQHWAASSADIELNLLALREQAPSLHGVAERFCDAHPAAPAPVAERVLLHSDLDTEHMLVDPQAGRITGFIDWGDVQLGPAIIDFMGIYMFGGRGFTETVLSHYGGRVEPRDLVWLRGFALQRAMENVRYGRLGGKPSYLQAGLRGVRVVLEQ